MPANVKFNSLLLTAFVFVSSCGNRGGEAAGMYDSSGGVSGHESGYPHKINSDIEYIHAAHIFRSSYSSADSFSLSDDPENLYLMRSIRERIESGESSFEEMAEQYSECPSSDRGGRLPDVTVGTLTAPLDNAIKVLEPGEISDVVRTRFGYHLVKRLEY
jgi:peptidyl-prolyl cis-trans isomerase C